MSAEPSPFVTILRARAAHVDVEVRERAAHRMLDPCGLLAMTAGSCPDSCTATRFSPGARRAKGASFRSRRKGPSRRPSRYRRARLPARGKARGTLRRSRPPSARGAADARRRNHASCGSFETSLLSNTRKRASAKAPMTKSATMRIKATIPAMRHRQRGKRLSHSYARVRRPLSSRRRGHLTSCRILYLFST